MTVTSAFIARVGTRTIQPKARSTMPHTAAWQCIPSQLRSGCLCPESGDNKKCLCPESGDNKKYHFPGITKWTLITVFTELLFVNSFRGLFLLLFFFLGGRVGGVKGG